MSERNPYYLFNDFSNIFFQSARNIEKGIESLVKETQKLAERKIFPDFINNQMLASANFFLGNWYLGNNLALGYKDINSFKMKFLYRLICKIQKGEISFEEILDQFKFAIDKETEMLITDEKKYAKVRAEYIRYGLEALTDYFSGDTRTMVKFSDHYKDEQFWVEKMMKRLKENVRHEYGIDVSSRKVFSTEYLSLLEIVPIYKDGENSDDYDYIDQPIVILPPTVLDHHIVGLLPNYDMSMVHYFAKRCPVYVMIVNDYRDEHVLNMIKEDLVLHMIKVFEYLKLIENEKPIFCGYCQGGTIAIMSALTGKLDEYIKAVFGVVSPTGKKKEQEDLGPLALVFEDIELVGELVNGSLMVGREFLSIGLKEAGWSPGSDVVRKMLEAKKYRERIRQDIKNGKSFIDAEKSLTEEIIKKIVLDIWLGSMENVPLATTEMSLAAFKNGIDPNGFYNIEMFGKKLNVNYFNESQKGLYLFAAQTDRVVPPNTVFEIVKYIEHAKHFIIPTGHIGLCTNFKDNLHEPIFNAIKEVALSS